MKRNCINWTVLISLIAAIADDGSLGFIRRTTLSRPARAEIGVTFKSSSAMGAGCPWGRARCLNGRIP